MLLPALQNELCFYEEIGGKQSFPLHILQECALLGPEETQLAAKMKGGVKGCRKRPHSEKEGVYVLLLSWLPIYPLHMPLILRIRKLDWQVHVPLIII